MKKISAILRGLSFEDLDDWAGATISSRGQSMISKVADLCRTPESELAAWVAGTSNYATLVRLDELGQHDSCCTCSNEWHPCKHAVAVVLAAAEQVRQKRAIPLLAQGDALHASLFGGTDAASPPQSTLREPLAAAPGGPPDRARKTGRASTVQKFLTQKNREELLALLVELAGRYPEIERRILEAEQLNSGQIEPLFRSLRQEIRRLTSEPAWYNHWTHEGSLPDYSHVEEQLRALLARDHADAVLELGEELWTKGMEQVEQSDDKGETGRAISACMAVVLRALVASSMPRSRQLLWVIDRMLTDEFSLLEGGDALLDLPVYTQDHWREVASELEDRLGAREGLRCSVFSDTYQRKEVMRRLIQAYRRGGWEERVLPLLEKEADLCQNYEQLVEELLGAGNREEARQWCIRGFGRTRENLPAVAVGLQKKLREIAGTEKKFELVAAYRAQDFFNRPALETFKELRRAAEKAGCWPEVRPAVLAYLESGERPDLSGKGRKGADWSLPAPEVSWPKTVERRRGQRFPERSVLIEIAIMEKQFDEVVRLFRELEKTGRLNGHVGLMVAKAVAQSHPGIALGIWRGMVDGLIGQVKPQAYVEAAGYLRLMHKVYEAEHRLPDWQALLAELRRTHKAKRRLMTVLDGLAEGGKKLVD